MPSKTDTSGINMSMPIKRGVINLIYIFPLFIGNKSCSCYPFTSLLSHSCQKQVWEWEDFHTSLCWGITVGNEVWTRSSTSFCHKEWEGAHCSTGDCGQSSGDHSQVPQITVVSKVKEWTLDFHAIVSHFLLRSKATWSVSVVDFVLQA